MKIAEYTKFYNQYFTSKDYFNDHANAMKLLEKRERIFFIGNGGSMSICSHMMEDYGKFGRYKTYAFSDAALITCYANDYGYENAIKEWINLYFSPDDLLIAISSSGNSDNILNAVDEANRIGGDVITLSGFKPDNKLRTKGSVNFFLEKENYGIVENFHSVVLHVMLDETKH